MCLDTTDEPGKLWSVEHESMEDYCIKVLADLLEPQPGETASVELDVGLPRQGEVEEIWTPSEKIRA